MKFILENPPEEKPLTFADVETNQFFVDHDGYLCQKSDKTSFVVIAKPDGTPYADYFSSFVYHCNKIQRILPKVKKIEF